MNPKKENLFAVTVNVNPNSFVKVLEENVQANVNVTLRKRWKNISPLIQRNILMNQYVNKLSDHNLTLYDIAFERCESGNVHCHLFISGDLGDFQEHKLFFVIS